MPEDKIVDNFVPPALEGPEADVEASIAADAAEREAIIKEDSKPEPKIAKKPEVEAPIVVSKSGDAQAAYVLNKKFKVLDKEQEFDDFIASHIKDADSEKKVRELYEKAYGLDHVKAERAQERAAREKSENNLNNLIREIQDVSTHARNKDFGRMLKELQIKKEDLAAWLVQQHEVETNLSTLPEPVRKAYNEFGTLKEQNEALARKVEALESGSQDSAVQARATELKSSLQAPDVAKFVTEFDARVGKPGAFEDQVMRYGYSEWQLHKRDVSAKEAVDEVLKFLGHSIQAASPAATPNESATPRPVVITPPKATVIPNVGAGTSAASTMKRPTSIDDLRKMAQAMRDSA